jgi:hypothetical protein
MRSANDKERAYILEALGIGPDALIGQGGEAAIYALDADSIARIYHAGTDKYTVAGRTALLQELAASAMHVPFAIPTVLQTLVFDQRLVTIERRLPGRPLGEVLGEYRGQERLRLVRAYLEAASQIGELRIVRPWYGDLIRQTPIRTKTFGEYLRQRAAHSLAAAGDRFAGIDPARLAAALPEPDEGAFVHLDAFPGNMLVEGTTVTAVVDFGAVAILGDRRLDVLSAAAYLTPLITPTATVDDRTVAHEWLVEHNLADLYEPAQRWIAAFWAFAHDDRALFQWCQSVLLS